jgi:hypothetical protein
MVLVSIIMGLGITTLLRGSVKVLQAGSGMTPGLLHGLWVGQILVAQVGLWAIRWTAEQRSAWSGPVMLLFLVMPVAYYALAELLFPPPGSSVALNEHFLDNRRGFFGLLIVTSIAGAVGPSLFYQAPADRAGIVMLLGLIPGYVFFAINRNPRLHTIWAVVVLLVYLLFLAVSSVG